MEQSFFIVFFAGKGFKTLHITLVSENANGSLITYDILVRLEAISDC